MALTGTKITIGGLAGTGKGTVGKLLSEHFGYELCSAGKCFRDIAVAERIPLSRLEELANGDSQYDIKVDGITKVYGASCNHFIFEGRIAWMLIPDSVKVLLVCNKDTRIRRVAGREDISFDDALRATEHREALAQKRYHSLYGIEDIEDTRLYDFVVNTTYLDEEMVMAAIVGSLVTHGLYVLKK